MSQDKLLPAIQFLEDRIQALVFAVNYLRNHAGFEPCALVIPPNTKPPGTPPK